MLGRLRDGKLITLQALETTAHSTSAFQQRLSLLDNYEHFDNKLSTHDYRRFIFYEYSSREIIGFGFRSH